MRKTGYLLPLIFVLLFLAPPPAQAFWKTLCSQVAGVAGYFWSKPAPEPSRVLEEMETRLARLFRSHWSAGPQLEELNRFDQRFIALMNFELVARQGKLYGSWDPNGVAAFIAGTPVDRIFLITHQAERYQLATGHFLESPELVGVPRIALASDSYPISHEKFRRQITLLQISRGGEMNGIVFNTSELHVAGGFYNFCLITSLHQAVASMFSFSERAEATVVFHSSLLYTMSQSKLLTLKELADRLPPDVYQYEEAKMVRGLLDPNQEWRRLDRPGYVYENPAGQRLALVIQN